MCIIDCLSTIVFILPLHLDYTKVIILILWWRNFQLEYWRTFQLVSTVNSHKTQSTQLVCISQREKTAYSLFRNDLSWNGGGYRVKETFLRYYRNIVFSIKIKGDKTTPGADLGDNDFVGKPEIVSCEAIVYTKDGDGWIGAKIEKK